MARERRGEGARRQLRYLRAVRSLEEAFRTGQQTRINAGWLVRLSESRMDLTFREPVVARIRDKRGKPTLLEIRDVPPPPLPDHDYVLVRVRAAVLNRADVLQRRGHYPASPGAPKDIPGLEFAGEVDQIGGGVPIWKRGQRVGRTVGWRPPSEPKW